MNSAASRPRANIKGFAFEYMTSGRGLVIGNPGPWLCSGMTGGEVYLKFDEMMGLDEAALKRRLAKGAEVEIVAVEGSEDEKNLREMLSKYISALDAHEQKEEADAIRLCYFDHWLHIAICCGGHKMCTEASCVTISKITQGQHLRAT
ncbi:MAG: hypothetical protein LH647_06050 [Leptolyngbyaceae cyanobacterium CAN_BIN12]|nr:hypothetical protein [Leptolyngbyaceae cyanobacterium CAN_BIN12]